MYSREVCWKNQAFCHTHTHTHTHVQLHKHVHWKKSDALSNLSFNQTLASQNKKMTSSVKHNELVHYESKAKWRCEKLRFMYQMLFS